MLRKVDELLNSYTMYKVVLWGLMFLALVAFGLAGLELIWPSVLDLGVSLTVIMVSCLVSNWAFAKMLRAPVNVESTPITAFILFLILFPTTDPESLVIQVWTSAIAMGSKYLFAWKKKHLFNPVAIALVIGAFLGSGEAVWWVASKEMLPFCLVVGLLVVRKVRRFGMFFTFVVSGLLMIMITGLLNDADLGDRLVLAMTSFPIIFMGTIMLTEPLTTPARYRWQLVYGGLVGILFGSQFHVGPIYSTPELALVVGNVFSYIVNPKYKLFLKLKRQEQTAREMYDFIFDYEGDFRFEPGQYMEWTLPHPKPDMRGNRRYFTVASSPTERDIHLGVKIVPDDSSSFKKHLLKMKKGDEMVVHGLAGDFVLPEDLSKPAVFIAGGIGVTPFRSMVKYLIDMKLTCDVVMFYVCRDEDDFAYREVFDAAKGVGIKMVYVITRKENAPKGWKGEVGYIDKEMIRRQVVDWKKRTFYLSGPHGMVTAYEDVLQDLGVKRDQVVVDFFPGF